MWKRIVSALIEVLILEMVLTFKDVYPEAKKEALEDVRLRLRERRARRDRPTIPNDTRPHTS